MVYHRETKQIYIDFAFAVYYVLLMYIMKRVVSESSFNSWKGQCLKAIWRIRLSVIVSLTVDELLEGLVVGEIMFFEKLIAKSQQVVNQNGDNKRWWRSRLELINCGRKVEHKLAVAGVSSVGHWAVRDRRQISLLILSRFKGINDLLVVLKSESLFLMISGEIEVN